MPGSRDTDGTALLHETATNVIRSLDVLFGTISVALALFGTWALIHGRTSPATVVALWLIPIINLSISVITRRRARVPSELVRSLVSLPVATYLYVADRTGMLHEMWLPALMMVVGGSLSLGIATRRGTHGLTMTFVYAGAIVGAVGIRYGTFDAAVIDDVLGIVVTGIIISVIASRIGGLLDEARHQRDLARELKARAEEVRDALKERTAELTSAIGNLHHEMEHRVRVEGELLQAQKLESVGRLAAGIAHEINTPVQFVSDSIEFVRNAVTDLFALVDQLETAQRSVSEGVPFAVAASAAADATAAADLPYLTENVPKALQLAVDGLGRVATIVRSMREFAHPDAKEMVPTDLNRAIESTLTLAHNEYKYVADLETDLGVLPLVHCHAGELNQAVLNIVVNAAHAIGDVVCGTAARGCIRVRTHRDGDDVVISIGDTGGGIPSAIRDQIFDPFFTTKGIGRGTGQGLNLARSMIMNKHHGKLTFSTEMGVGTTFYIRLPIHGTCAPAVAEAA